MSSEETPLLVEQRNHNAVYDRFTRRQKRVIVAVVSWAGLLPCTSLILPSDIAGNTENIFVANRCSICGGIFYTFHPPNRSRPWFNWPSHKVGIKYIIRPLRVLKFFNICMQSGSQFVRICHSSGKLDIRRILDILFVSFQFNLRL